eukprot:CAMPEP_0118693758 /NCGR_PEP_ID=MMETSP0800-20121206/12099_1 /TAXON_ID=210618 ORGANISM="Striatella unipunctata, Strain CCMP2910" /NCGR_SAMPLE_ID=MMETSP0800 /ASSEMBLY_ACC=CAM_ASM_000638 /LENGTH=49 /DNA_ID=CAMNT_0006592055 /DNA_START=52 /DNA_END=201 /DNA_ORIENTATION=-
MPWMSGGSMQKKDYTNNTDCMHPRALCEEPVSPKMRPRVGVCDGSYNQK